MEAGRLPLNSLNLGDDEIAVEEDLDGVWISWVVTEWHSHMPHRALRKYAFRPWRDMPKNPLAAANHLQSEVRRALHARRSSYRRCHFCRDKLAPELLHHTEIGWVCHGCAERELGVVH